MAALDVTPNMIVQAAILMIEGALAEHAKREAQDKIRSFDVTLGHVRNELKEIFRDGKVNQYDLPFLRAVDQSLEQFTVGLLTEAVLEERAGASAASGVKPVTPPQDVLMATAAAAMIHEVQERLNSQKNASF
jgi:hypothetical protein